MVDVNIYYCYDCNYIFFLCFLKCEEILNLDFLFEDYGWDWYNFDEWVYQCLVFDFIIVVIVLEIGKVVIFINVMGEEFIIDLKVFFLMFFVFEFQVIIVGFCLDGGVVDLIFFDIV